MNASAQGITKAPPAAEAGEGREINWDWIRGMLVGMGMFAGMAIYVLSWPPNNPRGLEFDGHWSESSYGFDLAGGDYTVGWSAPCPLTVDLYAGDGTFSQVVDTPGPVAIAEGSWFFAVTGDCDWRITVDRVLD